MAGAKPTGAVDIFDGRNYAGSILAQRGQWVSYDAAGHRIGTHDSEREASAAVNAARGR